MCLTIHILDCRIPDSACDVNQPRVLTDLSGNILSPTGFTDGRYLPNKDCSWLIDLPDPNRVIYFQILQKKISSKLRRSTPKVLGREVKVIQFDLFKPVGLYLQGKSEVTSTGSEFFIMKSLHIIISKIYSQLMITVDLPDYNLFFMSFILLVKMFLRYVHMAKSN